MLSSSSAQPPWFNRVSVSNFDSVTVSVNRPDQKCELESCFVLLTSSRVLRTHTANSAELRLELIAECSQCKAFSVSHLASCCVR